MGAVRVAYVVCPHTQCTPTHARRQMANFVIIIILFLVCRAHTYPHTHAQGKCDPYCIVQSGNERFQTEHKLKTYDADFNQVFKLVDGVFFLHIIFIILKTYVADLNEEFERVCIVFFFTFSLLLLM